MLQDTMLAAVANSVTHVSLIATEGAGSTRLPVVLAHDHVSVWNTHDLSFNVPPRTRVVGIRLFDAAGRVVEEIASPEQVFQRRGRMLFLAGEIRLTVKKEAV